ncbi:GroES-like protein [Apiospora hydei]|uniref:GroES-like protein n=1 Tax=Apiospora hydei TaxID=1337664 RepID=A0ABR1X0C0_9PEZI
MAKGPGESPVTDPDLRPPISNAWAGASLSAIETFAEAVWNPGSANAIMPDLYLVVDEEGLAGKNCIVAQRICSFEENPSGGCETHLAGVHDYNRVRVPWDGAGTVFVNLSIANLGFEDFVEYDFDKDVNVYVNAPTADGQGRWWTANENPSIQTAEDKQKEAELLARLEKEGLV